MTRFSLKLSADKFVRLWESDMDAVMSRARVLAGRVQDFPEDSGAAVKVGSRQIAVYRMPEGNWYACNNECPHEKQMVLARGLTGDKKGEPIVACPMHKRVFSLESGKCLGDSNYSVTTYPVEIEGENVYLLLPE